MGTTTELALNERLAKAIGDFIRVAVSTNIAADNLVVATDLNEHDDGEDKAFQDRFLYIENKNNEDKDRKVRFYYTANGTCNIFGAALSSDTNVADIQIHRYSYTKKRIAINDAIKELYPILYREIDDNTAITTNSALYEYALPAHMLGGEVRQVLINTTQTTITAEDYNRVWNWSQINEGRTLRMPGLFASGHKVRVIGTAPINTLSGPANTIPLSGESQLSLLTAYAKYKLYQSVGQPVSSEDVSRYKNDSAEAYGEYLRLLPRARMPKPSTTIKFRGF